MKLITQLLRKRRLCCRVVLTMAVSNAKMTFITSGWLCTPLILSMGIHFLYYFFKYGLRGHHLSWHARFLALKRRAVAAGPWLSVSGLNCFPTIIPYDSLYVNWCVYHFPSWLVCISSVYASWTGIALLSMVLLQFLCVRCALSENNGFWATF